MSSAVSISPVVVGGPALRNVSWPAGAVGMKLMVTFVNAVPDGVNVPRFWLPNMTVMGSAGKSGLSAMKNESKAGASATPVSNWEIVDGDD